MVGPTKTRDRLGVVRLGGHREVGESSWQCAYREVREEASVRIQPIQPPVTYWSSVGEVDSSIEPGSWPLEVGAQPPIRPLLVRRRVEVDGLLSVMYLAWTDDTPAPAAEATGLLLLTRVDVARLARETMTLRQYLHLGGRALLRDELPLDLPLQPFAQLQWLDIIWKLHPDLFDT
jgi:8-oxo-dGTP pyrophosphatase MutT (NUDIX family)